MHMYMYINRNLHVVGEWRGQRTMDKLGAKSLFVSNVQKPSTVHVLL